MSCCGQKRQALGKTQPFAKPPPSRGPAPPATGPVEFEYVGHSVLVVMGQGTRTAYRFMAHGARMMADVRDRQSLAMVPGLREVVR